MKKDTEVEVRSIYSIKSDLFSSYNEFYSKFEAREKRDMYFYWKGMIRAFCISWDISSEGEKELNDYLLDVFCKIKKYWFSKKEFYTLR